MTDSPTSDRASQENYAQSTSASEGSTLTTVAPIFKVVKGNPNATELAAIQLALDTLQAEAKQRYKATERNQWGEVDELLNHVARQVFNPNAYSTRTYH